MIKSIRFGNKTLKISSSFKKDIDFNDFLGITMTLNAWSRQGSIMENNKYLTVDLFCRRIFQLKLTEVTVG